MSDGRDPDKSDRLRQDVEGDVTTIRLTTEALTRRGSGRVPTAELPHQVEDDEAVATALLDSLAITP